MRHTTARPFRVLLAALLVVSSPLAAQPFELEEATIADVHTAMRAGDLTCRTLVERYLARIEAYDQQGPRLNAVQTINSRALETADRLDAALASDGLAGPLHCIPVLLKDQVETDDMPTTYGSALFSDFVPARDATIVTRLEEAGALILAKTNMGELASRYVGSAFGVIRNAYAPDRNPSGSSGGTGSGVAANFGMVGIGEDTGGSIRGPAAVQSLVGLRPTVPLVSRHGMMPANPTTDTMGPMTRTVTDAAIVLDAIAGYDPNDPVTAYAAREVPESYAAGLESDALRGARIGVIREPMDSNADPTSADYRSVHAVFSRAVDDLRRAGAEIVDSVSIEGLETVNALAATNRFETERATDDYLAQHPGAPYRTLKSILASGVVNPWRAAGLMHLIGRSTDEAGYAEYVVGRDALRIAFMQTLADHDLDAVVYPTFDHPPSRIALDVETNPAPADDYGLGDNRALSPVLAFPALTVPAGFTEAGLPVGLELLGRAFAEHQLLRFGYAYEQATRHRRPPPTTPPLTERP
ncbi:MAG: amidase [Gemmatimonadetes bacterium]|nr:amidase [Gemmatimonadota bacterium]